MIIFHNLIINNGREKRCFDCNGESKKQEKEKGKKIRILIKLYWGKVNAVILKQYKIISITHNNNTKSI